MVRLSGPESLIQDPFQAEVHKPTHMHTHAHTHAHKHISGYFSWLNIFLCSFFGYTFLGWGSQ